MMLGTSDAWSTIRFVPSSKRPSVLFCKLTDFRNETAPEDSFYPIVWGVQELGRSVEIGRCSSPVNLCPSWHGCPKQCYFQRGPTLELLYLQLSKQSWKCFEFVIMFEQEKANRSSFSHENHITKSGQKFLKLWGAQCWIVYVLAFKILIVWLIKTWKHE